MAARPHNSDLQTLKVGCSKPLQRNLQHTLPYLRFNGTHLLKPLLVLQVCLFMSASCAGQEASGRSKTDTDVAENPDSLNAAKEIILRFSKLQNEAVSISTNKRSNKGKNDSSEADISDAKILGLTAPQFESFLSSATQHSEEYVGQVLGDCHEDEGKDSCAWKDGCPGTAEIFTSYASNDQLLGPEALRDALPVAINTLTASTCTSKSQAHDKLYHAREKKRPTTLETWLYGTGFCTLVVIISNIGAFLGPCMESKFFKRLLQFLVSMGAGSLASTGLLVLIPEAFDIMSVEELAHGYVWKATVAILSIFTFFCSERLLKTFLYSKKRKEMNHSLSLTDDMKRASEHESQLKPLTDKPSSDIHNRNANGRGDAGDAVKVRGHGPADDVGHGHSHGHGAEERRTLAWMVMAGDVIHNFVDGLSVGAAFTEDISLGISISLAILCEELPHELADIAILLHSGLSIKRAIFINFLSACMCYVGLVLGIAVGSTIHAANKWIFAMAGGLFLYVPLVDMLPDMSSHLDQLMASGSKEAKVVAVLHLVGLLVGTAIIIFIVNINEYIVVG